MSSEEIVDVSMVGCATDVQQTRSERRAMVEALASCGFTKEQIAEFSQLPVLAIEVMLGGDDAIGDDEVCAYLSGRARKADNAVERRQARLERRRRAEEMLRSGVSQAEVARKFGLSRAWANIVARDIGLAGNVRQQRALERKARIEAERASKRETRAGLERDVLCMLDEGMSQSEVAHKIGRSQSWVSLVARGHGRIGRLSSDEARKRDALVVSDAKAGVTFDELLDKYDLHGPNLMRILQKYGVSARRR